MSTGSSAQSQIRAWLSSFLSIIYDGAYNTDR